MLFWIENVRIHLELPEGFQVVHIIPCPRLEYNVGGVCYVILSTPEDMAECAPATLSPSMKFIVKDCDPSTGEPDSDDGKSVNFMVKSDSPPPPQYCSSDF